MVTAGIRPENVSDSEIMVSRYEDASFEARINVYELLGAEVFLYFELEGFPMTARVDPRTTARTGDHIRFALDMERIHLFDKETEQSIVH